MPLDLCHCSVNTVFYYPPAVFTLQMSQALLAPGLARHPQVGHLLLEKLQDLLLLLS